MKDATPETPSSPDDPPADGPLLFGCILDGQGGCSTVDWATAMDWQPSGDAQTLWLHLDRVHDGLDTWLENKLNLNEATAELLLSNETRPRAFKEGEALITVLRGINFNPGAEPEDMIAMQIWCDGNRLITLRRRRLQTPRDIFARLTDDAGPHTAGDLFTDLVEQMVVKMNRAIVEMNERIDEMEDDADSDIDDLLTEIADIRRNCLALKRYMSPQRDAFLVIQRDPPAWLSEKNLTGIRETGERLQRYLDDLDVSKESALVLQDDLNNRAAAKMNQTMYMLSIVAAIFLPLGFITGLLGINVGGMPGVDSGYAFWITVGMLALMIGLQFWIFRKLKWL
ncbi:MULTISPECIES: zinc transporter ZntB [Henriciella]|jgi:zinc transporter|uniref:Transporter n=1 Tax=Henriciella pelagia TaxID=1977912 RepID=A0ABQ1IZQ9_9PROT|nr:zinc transporter ZntB [Henriciella pelagia]GGB56599.1 transporter [Henriciella pelagia]